MTTTTAASPSTAAANAGNTSGNAATTAVPTTTSASTSTTAATVGTVASATTKATPPTTTVVAASAATGTTPSKAGTTTTTATSSSSVPPAPTAAAATATTAAASLSTMEVAKKTEVADVLEERLIDAEYKIWKKNTPYLYDVVMTHALEWPSLTCQWLPTVRTKDSSSTCCEHSLLLGTHTTGEQNYLMVVSCNLPRDDTVVPVEPTAAAAAATTTATGKDKNSSTSPPSTPPTATTATHAASVASIPTVSYDEEKNEVGGFGFQPSSGTSGSANLIGASSSTSSSSSMIGKLDIRMKVQHQGEVNRARCMPQNHFMVATRGPDPELYIFDLSKHPSIPAENSVFSPQAVCMGHSKEGYGLAWSKLKEGYLCSASEDTTVCIWDIQSAGLSGETGKQIHPITTLKGHTNVVEDVDWHAKDPNMIVSVGDDRSIRLWDIRQNKPIHVVAEAHTEDVNCVAFNPINEYIFCTGSADKTIGLWDVRNLKTKCQTLNGHNDQVYMVEWSPFNESILGSCSADRRVAVWDLSRIGMEQTAEDAEDGPPELLFLHGGHTSKVSDFSWNAQDPWTIASVSEDNILQVWNMAEEIYTLDDDNDEEEEEQNGDNGNDSSSPQNKKRKKNTTGAGEDQLLAYDELE